MTRGQICNKLREMGWNVSTMDGKKYTAVKGETTLEAPTPMGLLKKIKQIS